MKFPVPKTMTTAMLPTLLINWILGIGVVEYPLGQPRRIASAIWSFANILVFFGYLRMANLSDIFELENLDIGSYSVYVVICLQSAFIVTSMCLAQLRSKVIADTISKLIGINDRMETLGIPNDYELFFRAQIIQLGSAITLKFMLMVIYCITISTVFPGESTYIDYSLASFYWMMVAFIVEYTFSSIIRYFGRRFQRLNAILLELGLLTRCGPTVVQSDDQFPYFTVIREIHGSNPSSIRAANKQWLLYVIRETRKIHRGLCNLTMEWNRAFGIQILFSVSLSFGLLTSLLYTSYTINTVEQYSDSLILGGWIYKILTLMWIIYYATKVIVIVNACEATSREANRTGGLINQILDISAVDEDIREEIDSFSLQLLQNPLKFTAHGFFTLDYSLVHAIIGSVTTYLTIMIQMKDIYQYGNVESTPNSTILIQRNVTH